jgi:hypothetical protein
MAEFDEHIPAEANHVAVVRRAVRMPLMVQLSMHLRW